MEKENLEMWRTALMGETLLLGLLGRILYQEPDKNWLETLVKEDVFAEVPFGEGQIEIINGLKLLQTWTNQNAGGILDKQFEAVKKDHLYLFTGIGRPLAPVWESVYFSESGMIFQKQTLEVREWYARYGLEAEKKGREPDDHIGLELSFVAHLATLALQSLEKDNQPQAEELLQAQRDFLIQHFLRWAPVWAELTEKHAETDFYRGLAHLTVGALLAAAELLEIEIPKEETK